MSEGRAVALDERVALDIPIENLGRIQFDVEADCPATLVLLPERPSDQPHALPVAPEHYDEVARARGERRGGLREGLGSQGGCSGVPSFIGEWSGEQTDRGACRMEGFVFRQDVPDVLGQTQGEIDTGDLGAALAAEPEPP